MRARHTLSTPITPGRSVSLSELTSSDLEALGGDDLMDVIAERLGRPGLPWRGGRLQLERHRDLRITGGPGRRSKYQEVRQDPLVRGMLRRLTSSMARAPYRVDPCKLPRWLEDDEAAQAARDRQHAYCERMWWSWKMQGDEGWERWLRDNAQTTPIEGWSWYELVGDVRTVDLGDGPRDVLWLNAPPEWRSVESVRYWLHDNERLIGLIADFSTSSDYQGGRGDSWVVFPAAKLLIVSTGRVASNITGESWLRSVFNWLKAKRTLFQLDMVGSEVNGVGELVIELPDGKVDDKDIVRYTNYIKYRTSKSAPGLVVKSGTKVYRLEPSKAEFENLRNYIEQQLALSWGQDHRLMALQKAGAYNAREQASDEADDILGDATHEMVSGPIQRLWSRLIRISFPDDAERGWVFTPSLEWIESDGQLETSDLARAVDAGLVQWTVEDEQAWRTRSGLPQRVIDDNAEEITAISPDVLQALRLAYGSGVLHDPDIGPVLRAGLGVPEMTQEGFEAFLRLVKGVGGTGGPDTGSDGDGGVSDAKDEQDAAADDAPVSDDSLPPGDTSSPGNEQEP